MATMNRRNAVGALALGSTVIGLGSCGGGGGARLSIDLTGDSVLSGELQSPPAPWPKLPRTVAAELFSLTGRPVFDYTRSGAKVGEALAGTLGFGRLADHVRDTPSKYIVLGYAGADALDGTPMPLYEQRMHLALDHCLGAGLVAILTTTYPHADPRTHALSVAVTEVVRRIGAQRRVAVADLWDVAGPFIDPVHKGPPWPANAAREIAKFL